jgi:hypothetical protein
MFRPLRLLALLAALSAAVALAQSNSYEYAAKTFTQDLSGAAPSTDEDGVSLDRVQGWSVCLSAPSGQVITGGGATCYDYAAISSSGVHRTPVTRRWLPCDSELNFTPATGQRDACSLNFVSDVKAGRIAYVPSAVTVLLSDGGVVRMADGGIQDGGTVDVTIEIRRIP